MNRRLITRWWASRHLFTLRLRRASLLDTVEELEIRYSTDPSLPLASTLLSTRRALRVVTLSLARQVISTHCPLLDCA